MPEPVNDNFRDEIAKTMYVFATQGVLTAEKQWAERPAIRQEYLLLADALMPLVARIQAAAWDAALEHVWMLADPVRTIDTLGGNREVMTGSDVIQARRENPYRADRLEQGDPS